MTAIWLEGHGITELAADLRKAGPEVEEKAKVVVQKSGHDVVARAQLICPVDTGALKNSIGVDFDGDGLGWEAGPTMNYAAYVEYGTSKMAPRAYMNPAFDYAVADAIELFEHIVDGVL